MHYKRCRLVLSLYLNLTRYFSTGGKKFTSNIPPNFPIYFIKGKNNTLVSLHLWSQRKSSYGEDMLPQISYRIVFISSLKIRSNCRKLMNGKFLISLQSLTWKLVYSNFLFILLRNCPFIWLSNLLPQIWAILLISSGFSVVLFSHSKSYILLLSHAFLSA